MSAMETTFTVRTDTDNDAMQVPDGIETVVVNDSAERVIVPPGVQIIRLQVANSGGGGESRSLIDRLDEYTRVSYSGAADAPAPRVKRAPSPRIERAPPMAEKSLSLPSCPPTPPGSRSAGTDVPDFRAAQRPPPTAEALSEEPAVPEAERPASAPSAPAQEAPPQDIFDDRTPEVERKRVINQQPAPAANGRAVHYYAGATEQEMKDPLVSHGSVKMRKLDSFGWREEFELGEKESKPTIQKFGRAVADILCCWLGV